MGPPVHVTQAPPVLPGVPVTISATTYMSYRRCPAQALARLGGSYPADTIASFRGGLAHRVFARHLDRGPIADDGFSQVCREEIGTSMNPKITSLGLKPRQIDGVIQEVGHLYRRFKVLPSDGFTAAEVEIEAEPWDGVTLKGIIDAVFGERGLVRLVDWKTGAVGMAEDQMQFYALLWWLARGEIPIRLEAMSVATGEQVALETTVGEVEATLAEIATMVSAIRGALGRNESLPTRAGPWCRYCPELEGCSDGAAAAAVASR